MTALNFKNLKKSKIANEGKNKAKDDKFVNFSKEQEYEPKHILDMIKKEPSPKNIEILKTLGKKCKEELGKTILTHDEFYEFLEDHLDELEDIE